MFPNRSEGDEMVIDILAGQRQHAMSLEAKSAIPIYQMFDYPTYNAVKITANNVDVFSMLCAMYQSISGLWDEECSKFALASIISGYVELSGIMGDESNFIEDAEFVHGCLIPSMREASSGAIVDFCDGLGKTRAEKHKAFEETLMSIVKGITSMKYATSMYKQTILGLHDVHILQNMNDFKGWADFFVEQGFGTYEDMAGMDQMVHNSLHINDGLEDIVGNEHIVLRRLKTKKMFFDKPELKLLYEICNGVLLKAGTKEDALFKPEELFRTDSKTFIRFSNTLVAKGASEKIAEFDNQGQLPLDFMDRVITCNEVHGVGYRSTMDSLKMNDSVGISIGDYSEKSSLLRNELFDAVVKTNMLAAIATKMVEVTAQPIRFERTNGQSGIAVELTAHLTELGKKSLVDHRLEALFPYPFV